MRQAHECEDVDASPDPRRWIATMDALAREPFYAAYKARVAALLAPARGERVLEIGCGTGDDARALEAGTGCVVAGAERSETLAREARARGLRMVVVADAHALPFVPGAFAHAYADRVVQHLADPQTALREAARVVVPGGRIVTADPDYSTQATTVGHPSIAARVLGHREHAIRNGTLAGRLRATAGDLGLGSTHAEEHRLEVSDPTAVDGVMGLRSWARAAARCGDLREDLAERWEADFDRVAAAGKFRYAVSFFVTVMRTPADVPAVP